jgi:asparaginyl-tRNA synthetase
LARAENSNTTGHLAEFWMIEPEIRIRRPHGQYGAGGSIAEAHRRGAMKERQEDLAFFDQRIEAIAGKREVRIRGAVGHRPAVGA